MSEFAIKEVKSGDVEKLVKGFIYTGVEVKHLDETEDVEERLRDLLRNGYAWVGLEDGKAICFGGIYPVMKGVYEGWVVLNDDAKKHIKAIISFAKRVIKWALGNICWRIQARCFASEEKAIKFIKKFGFKKEGVFRRYYNKKDSVVFSIIEEDLKCL